jgi:hypothetical protein
MAAEKAIHLETIRTSVKLSVNFAIANVASTVVTAAMAPRGIAVRPVITRSIVPVTIKRGAPC